MNKLFFLSLFLILGNQTFAWTGDMDSAIQKAKKQNKKILLNFSGSDWCLPCKKLKEGLFKNQTFIDFANDSLILVNLDFPLKSKNEDREYIARKDKWSEAYNPNGDFPLTLLLDYEGKILKKWTGNITLPAEIFLKQISET